MVVGQGRVVWSCTDYIMGSDRWIFQNMSVQDPRHNSNHIMVLGCLCGASLRQHSCYLGCKTRLLLRPPSRQMRIGADKIFTELQHAITKLEKRVARHNSWISAETWRIVD